MRSVTNQTAAPLAVAALGAAMMLAALTHAAWAQPAAPPDAAPALTPARAPSEASIDLAVHSGVAFIFSKQQADGHIPSRYANLHGGAVEALAALTALTAGLPPTDAPLAKAADYVRRTQSETVPARALRIIILSRLGQADDLPQIQADVAWLVRQGPTGGWGYGPVHPSELYKPGRTDTLNSHLAVLALAEASQAGANVSSAVWDLARLYWTKAQNEDGGWGLEPRSATQGHILQNSHAPATAAGLVAMLTIERKRLEAGPSPYDAAGKRATLAPPDLAAAEKARKWLTDHYDLDSIPGLPIGKADGWYYPYLLGFTRAAEHTGTRLVARDRWLSRLAERLVAAKQPDGHWPAPDGIVRDALNEELRTGDDVLRTALATLALARGRAGVLINKLVVGPSPESDVFDAHNIAMWYEQNCNQPVTWRLIDAKAQFGEFAQAPVLYINGQGDFAMPDALAAQVVPYLRNGGTVLVHAQGGDRLFVRKAQEYFLKLLPDYHEIRIAQTHPVFDIRFKIADDKRPALIGLGDYCRTRVFIVPTDLSGAWHHNLHATRPHAFQLAANIALYGMNGQHPASKFHRRRIGPAKPKRVIPIARVVHEGDWNTNPTAPARLSEVLADAVSIGVEERDGVKLANTAPPRDLALLWLTGTQPARLGFDAKDRLKAYITAGGTLLVDPAMGGEAFFNDAKDAIEKTFGKTLTKADDTSPILTGKFAGGIGAKVTTARYTTWPGRAEPTPSLPEVWQLELDGRIAVVISRYALTCPIEGLPTYGCQGLSRDDARRLAANVLLYAASRQ